MYPVDIREHDGIEVEVQILLKSASDSRLSDNETRHISDLVHELKDMFRKTFSSGPPAMIKELKIELTTDSKPVGVLIRNYSLQYSAFVQKSMKVLVEITHVYHNRRLVENRRVELIVGMWSIGSKTWARHVSLHGRTSTGDRTHNKLSVSHDLLRTGTDESIILEVLLRRQLSSGILETPNQRVFTVDNGNPCWGKIMLVKFYLPAGLQSMENSVRIALLSPPWVGDRQMFRMPVSISKFYRKPTSKLIWTSVPKCFEYRRPNELDLGFQIK